MASTLEEVENARWSKRPVLFSQIRAYVVNFEAPENFPRKFLYKGCSVSVGPKRLCTKSLEYSLCEHDPTGVEFSHFYRFDIFLTDGSLGGMPIRATLFGTAATLLGIGPLKFKMLSEDKQVRRVTEVIRTLPFCELQIRSGNGSAIVQCLVHIAGPASSARVVSTNSATNVGACGEPSSSSGRCARGLLSAKVAKEGPTFVAKEENMTVKRAVNYLSKKLLGLYESDDEE